MSAGDLSFFLRGVSGRLNVEFSFSSNLSDDFCFLIKLYKKSSTQNVHRVCQLIVSLLISSVSSWKITTLITNIIGIGVMLLLTFYLKLNKDKCVQIVGLFFFLWYFIYMYWMNFVKAAALLWILFYNYNTLRFGKVITIK